MNEKNVIRTEILTGEVKRTSRKKKKKNKTEEMKHNSLTDSQVSYMPSLFSSFYQPT